MPPSPPSDRPTNSPQEPTTSPLGLRNPLLPPAPLGQHDSSAAFRLGTRSLAVLAPLHTINRSSGWGDSTAVLQPLSTRSLSPDPGNDDSPALSPQSSSNPSNEEATTSPRLPKSNASVPIQPQDREAATVARIDTASSATTQQGQDSPASSSPSSLQTKSQGSNTGLESSIGEAQAPARSDATIQSSNETSKGATTSQPDLSPDQPPLAPKAAGRDRPTQPQSPSRSSSPTQPNHSVGASPSKSNPASPTREPTVRHSPSSQPSTTTQGHPLLSSTISEPSVQRASEPVTQRSSEQASVSETRNDGGTVRHSQEHSTKGEGHSDDRAPSPQQVQAKSDSSSQANVIHTSLTSGQTPEVANTGTSSIQAGSSDSASNLLSSDRNQSAQPVPTIQPRQINSTASNPPRSDRPNTTPALQTSPNSENLAKQSAEPPAESTSIAQAVGTPSVENSSSSRQPSESITPVRIASATNRDRPISPANASSSDRSEVSNREIPSVQRQSPDTRSAPSAPANTASETNGVRQNALGERPAGPPTAKSSHPSTSTSSSSTAIHPTAPTIQAASIAEPPSPTAHPDEPYPSTSTIGRNEPTQITEPAIASDTANFSTHVVQPDASFEASTRTDASKPFQANNESQNQSEIYEPKHSQVSVASEQEPNIARTPSVSDRSEVPDVQRSPSTPAKQTVPTKPPSTPTSHPDHSSDLPRSSTQPSSISPLAPDVIAQTDSNEQPASPAISSPDSSDSLIIDRRSPSSQPASTTAAPLQPASPPTSPPDQQASGTTQYESSTAPGSSGSSTPEIQLSASPLSEVQAGDRSAQSLLSETATPSSFQQPGETSVASESAPPTLSTSANQVRETSSQASSQHLQAGKQAESDSTPAAVHHSSDTTTGSEARHPSVQRATDSAASSSLEPAAAIPQDQTRETAVSSSSQSFETESPKQLPSPTSEGNSERSTVAPTSEQTPSLIQRIPSLMTTAFNVIGTIVTNAVSEPSTAAEPTSPSLSPAPEETGRSPEATVEQSSTPPTATGTSTSIPDRTSPSVSVPQSASASNASANVQRSPIEALPNIGNEEQTTSVTEARPPVPTSPVPSDNPPDISRSQSPSSDISRRSEEPHTQSGDRIEAEGDVGHVLAAGSPPAPTEIANPGVNLSPTSDSPELSTQSDRDRPEPKSSVETVSTVADSSSANEPSIQGNFSPLSPIPPSTIDPGAQAVSTEASIDVKPSDFPAQSHPNSGQSEGNKPVSQTEANESLEVATEAQDSASTIQAALHSAVDSLSGSSNSEGNVSDFNATSSQSQNANDVERDSSNSIANSSPISAQNSSAIQTKSNDVSQSRSSSLPATQRSLESSTNHSSPDRATNSQISDRTSVPNHQDHPEQPAVQDSIPLSSPVPPSDDRQSEQFIQQQESSETTGDRSVEGQQAGVETFPSRSPSLQRHPHSQIAKQSPSALQPPNSDLWSGHTPAAAQTGSSHSAAALPGSNPDTNDERATPNGDRPLSPVENSPETPSHVQRTIESPTTRKPLEAQADATSAFTTNQSPPIVESDLNEPETSSAATDKLPPSIQGDSERDSQSQSSATPQITSVERSASSPIDTNAIPIQQQAADSAASALKQTESSEPSRISQPEEAIAPTPIQHQPTRSNAPHSSINSSPNQIIQPQLAGSIHQLSERSTAPSSTTDGVISSGLSSEPSSSSQSPLDTDTSNSTTTHYAPPEETSSSGIIDQNSQDKGTSSDRTHHHSANQFVTPDSDIIRQSSIEPDAVPSSPIAHNTDIESEQQQHHLLPPQPLNSNSSTIQRRSIHPTSSSSSDADVDPKEEESHAQPDDEQKSSFPLLHRVLKPIAALKPLIQPSRSPSPTSPPESITQAQSADGDRLSDNSAPATSDSRPVGSDSTNHAPSPSITDSQSPDPPLQRSPKQELPLPEQWSGLAELLSESSVSISTPQPPSPSHTPSSTLIQANFDRDASGSSTIQPQWDETLSANPSETTDPEQLNAYLDTLAREVYNMLRLRLERDRERNGNSYSGRLPW